MTFETILEEALKGKFIEVYLCKPDNRKGFCALDERSNSELIYALITGIDITEEDHEEAFINLIVDICGVEYSVEIESNFTKLKLK